MGSMRNQDTADRLMLSMLFDVVCLALVAWVSFRIADEGAFGAVVAFLTVLFAGLFAMNAFEPLAEWLGLHVSGSVSWQSRWDLFSLLGLFAGGIFVLRIITERLAPARIPIPQIVELPLRWIAGVLTGYLTLAILLTALHVAPLPRLVTKDKVHEALGFQAERAMFFGQAPDRQWLRFNQWISLHALNRGDSWRLFDGPVYHAGGEHGRWPSFPLRYADRRDRLTRSRMSNSP
jgi:hypothetical protein